MKTSLLTPLLAALALGSAATLPAAVQLSGAGATFPQPLYQRWASEYNKLHPDVQINYQGVGSGAGIKQFTAGTVDFAASDAAMKDEEIAAVKKGAVMIPATAGSIVIAYNLPGVKELKLSRDAYVGIFLGKITNWNDDAIKASNPGVELPDMPINVAYRSDGSGTTFVFTKHLAAISKDFSDAVGSDKSVTWPVGAGGKGNDGVTALIKATAGTVGYVEYGYAVNNGLAMASLQNKAGKFIAPDEKSGAATLASIELPENLRAWPEDPAGDDAYPIATFTWLLLYKTYDDAAKLDALKGFVKWGLTDGQKLASSLGYIPLPEAVVAKDQAALDSVK
ncbi:MAG TPA: phosphate ABC transporter substrate-binding protein PstS [Chthoniobacterales bacterium]|nr:phosphate ABC transporter substrate-binding protein PstS [Chthoniobacterales bacterium]